jgi:alpha-glucuronidase
MMMGSREAAVNYQTPLGLFQLNDNRTTSTQRSHYAPNPRGRLGHHNGDREGIGGSWLAKGLLKQYSPELQEKYGDPETCPEEFLLWFHKVSWDRPLSTGRTVWEELCYRYVMGVEYVRDMREQWASLQGKIDEDRWKDVRNKLVEHEIDAQVWRDECLVHFSIVSGKPISREALELATDLEK